MAFLRSKKPSGSGPTNSGCVCVDRKRLDDLCTQFIAVKNLCECAHHCSASILKTVNELEVFILQISNSLDIILNQVASSPNSPSSTPTTSSIPLSVKVRQPASASSGYGRSTTVALCQPHQLIIVYINRLVAAIEEHFTVLKQVLNKAISPALISADMWKRLLYILTRSRLQLTALQKEIEIFIPNGKEKKFICAKSEAEEWWTTHFGDCFFLDWEDFFAKFEDVFALDNGFVTQEVQMTLNFCGTDYISKFCFDLFTRFFAPWSKMTNVWRSLVCEHPAYLGMTTYEIAKDCLNPYRNKVGSYVFRFSSTKMGFWSIAYVKEAGIVAQVILKDRTLVEALTQGAKKKLYLYPFGRIYNPRLQHLQEEAILIQMEDVYSCGFGPSTPTTPFSSGDQTICADTRSQSSKGFSTLENPNSPRVNNFLSNEDTLSNHRVTITVDDANLKELCKICYARNKDTKMEPCGHLMCSVCLNNWMAKGDDCPFCRTAIRSIRRLIVAPSMSSPDSPSLIS